MKLQNLIVIFIIITLPIILIVSLYISTGLKTIEYQAMYDTGLINATHDAIYAFELNTTNDLYSDNAETKRNILKSSVKMFEKSLCNACNISAYNTDAIEEYIPAIVFGMYDGFYIYAPSYNSQTGKYEHDLKNYVYYSETLTDGTVISYSLDNYITVSGDFGNGYEIKSGYLIDPKNSTADGTKYKKISIDIKETDAINYYKEAYEFTRWFLDNDKANLDSQADYLKIGSNNDPENENSDFVKHKRGVIKNKIENVLNSYVTAYSNRIFGKTYKMPKFTEQDWQKVYNNISMITFFQGKKIGLTKYNGYCILNSTNNNEYANPNLMYFIEGEDNKNNYYHDIRCHVIKNSNNELTGYKIGAFKKKKVEETSQSGETIIKYVYDHEALACYECVNGPLNTNNTVYEYIKNASDKIKTAYWTSIARERYNHVHL